MSERNLVSEFEVAFGRNLRKWRRNQGFSLVEMSDRLTAVGRPMNKGWLSRIERGVDPSPPSFRLIVAAAHVLEIPPAVLLLPEEPAEILVGYMKEGLMGALAVVTEKLKARLG